MKIKSNFPIIIVFLILFVYITFLVFYVLSSNNIKSNVSNPNEEVSNSFSYIPPTKEEVVNTTKLSSYTTNLYDTEKNRVYNIKLACNNLNGTIVKPNAEFSFNNTLGDMGPNEGYKKATGFDSNGNNIKVYGGGICQLSSTLYNALLIAKLKVTERHAHSKRVYYVPKNKDATVFAGGPDLKFVNNLDSDIIINSSTDGYKVTVTLIKQSVSEIEK